MINRFDLFYKTKLIGELFTYIGKQLKPKLAPISENPYSTHIPVLIGLSSILKVKNILELGSGDYSTALFLNREAYPYIERIDSYEDNLIWGQKIRNDYCKDKRLNFNIVSFPIYKNLVNISYSQYDLIFVDDSQESSDRAKTIKEICRNISDNVIMIIHDFEVDSYRKAAKRIKHYFTFSSFTPCTGVLWNKGLKQKQLFTILDLIDRNKKEYKTTDIKSWLTVFRD